MWKYSGSKSSSLLLIIKIGKEKLEHLQMFLFFLLFLILDKISAKVLFKKMDERERKGETRVRKVCKKRMWPGVKCFYASKKTVLARSGAGT